MTSINSADFDFVLRYLWTNQDKHTFKAIWAPNVPFGPGESCGGLKTLCRYLLGSTQLAKEQMVDWKDGLLDLTYTEYKSLPGFTLPPAAESPLDLVDAQTTIFFQVIRTFFRFRQLPDPVNFLKDAETYEGIRSYMREGAQVAFTWNGPVAFSPIGQNTGRLPPTFQYTADEKLGLVFPTEKATTQLTYPSPATLPCEHPENQLRNFVNFSKCALCAPFCQTRCVPGERATRVTPVEGNSTITQNGCAKCPSGSYSVDDPGQDEVLSTECMTCAAGSYSKEGASTCTDCAAGANLMRRIQTVLRPWGIVCMRIAVPVCSTQELASICTLECLASPNVFVRLNLLHWPTAQVSFSRVRSSLPA